jgi:protein phosphatase 1 regulatory subunit 16A
VNVCDNDLWTPLHAAATCANLEICKILIQNNGELLAVNTDGNMPYDICDDEVCLEYIESEMATRGVTQQTIDFKRAEVEFKMLEDVKYMTVMGQDLNKRFDEQHGATLMHIACANGYSSVLEHLLAHKASINVRDNDGWTPLHVATFWGHVGI